MWCSRCAIALLIGGMLASIAATRAAGARDVLLLADARIAAHLREAQRLPLVGQAALGDRQLLLKPAHLEVVARHFRRHADPHVVDVGLEALGGRRGRANLRPDAAEDVDLPERIEAGAIRRDGTGSFREARNRLIPSIDARAGYGRRKSIERDVVEERARLIDPRDGHPHIVIGGQRPADQVVEHRILELLPPPRIERLLHDQRGVGVAKRGGCDRGRDVRRRRLHAADRAARECDR